MQLLQYIIHISILLSATPLSLNERIQYTVVFLLILAAIAYIIIKSVKASKSKRAGCCGCSLAETCTKNMKTGKRRHKENERN